MPMNRTTPANLNARTCNCPADMEGHHPLCFENAPEVLAGDDRNGVEGLETIYVWWTDDGERIRKWSRKPFAGGLPYGVVAQPVATDDEIRIVRMAIDDAWSKWCGGRTGLDGADSMAKAALLAIRALFRTPSSPQADEADVERVEQVVSAWAFAHDIDGAARNDLFKRLRESTSTMTTRPAGGEEVGWTIEHGPADEPVYLTAGMSWTKHRDSALHFARQVDADDMIEANGWEDFRVAALTKPAALPQWRCVNCKVVVTSAAEPERCEACHCHSMVRLAAPEVEQYREACAEANRKRLEAECALVALLREADPTTAAARRAQAVLDAVNEPAALPKEGEVLSTSIARLDEVLAFYDLPGTAQGMISDVRRALSSLPVRSAEVEKLREALTFYADFHANSTAGNRARAALAPPPQAQEVDHG